MVFFPQLLHLLSLCPFSLLSRRLHQQFESYKEQVRKIGEEARRYQGEHKDDAPTCGICHKTKFADGCGHLCSYCRTKFCARCGGRVSLRSSNVSTVAASIQRPWAQVDAPHLRLAAQGMSDAKNSQKMLFVCMHLNKWLPLKTNRLLVGAHLFSEEGRKFIFSVRNYERLESCCGQFLYKATKPNNLLLVSATCFRLNEDKINRICMALI